MFLLGIQYQTFQINQFSALNSIYLLYGEIPMKRSSGKIRQAPSTKSRHPRYSRPTANGGADGRSDETGRRKKRQRERKHGRRGGGGRELRQLRSLQSVSVCPTVCGDTACKSASLHFDASPARGLSTYEVCQ